MSEQSDTRELMPQPESQVEYKYPLQGILDKLVRSAGTTSYTYGRDLEAAVVGYMTFQRSKGADVSFEEILSSLKPNRCAALVDFLTINKTPNERSDSLSGILARRQKEGSSWTMDEVKEGLDRITIDQMLSPGEGVLRSALSTSLDKELSRLEESRRKSQLVTQGRVQSELYKRLLFQLKASPNPGARHSKL